MGEEKYYNIKEIMEFLGINYAFENKKEYPFCRKLENLKFMWGYIIIPRYGIEKVIQNKISDKEYRDILQKITMLINIPFYCDNKLGVITTDVSLTFRYDKEFKYGDVKKSIAEVCYAIEKYGTKTNNFYIIKEEWFQEFMSYFVINNQWGIGATTVVSAPEVRFDNSFNEISNLLEE
jgi:hypothetical protein